MGNIYKNLQSVYNLHFKHVQNILVLQVIATNYVSVRKRAKVIMDHTCYRNYYKSEVDLYALTVLERSSFHIKWGGHMAE